LASTRFCSGSRRSKNRCERRRFRGDDEFKVRAWRRDGDGQFGYIARLTQDADLPRILETATNDKDAIRVGERSVYSIQGDAEIVLHLINARTVFVGMQEYLEPMIVCYFVQNLKEFSVSERIALAGASQESRLFRRICGYKPAQNRVCISKRRHF